MENNFQIVRVGQISPLMQGAISCVVKYKTPTQVTLKPDCHFRSKKNGKGQETIQSSTTPDPGNQMGK